jgi:hypothetical protein
MATLPGRRVRIWWAQTKSLFSRRALEVSCMSASGLRDQPRKDRKDELLASIVERAHRHRGYGVGMICPGQHQLGECA